MAHISQERSIFGWSFLWFRQCSYFCLGLDMIMGSSCFLLLHYSHRVAVSDVAVLWKLCSTRAHHGPDVSAKLMSKGSQESCREKDSDGSQHSNLSRNSSCRARDDAGRKVLLLEGCLRSIHPFNKYFLNGKHTQALGTEL